MYQPRHRLSLQDLLAGIGCIATVAGAFRFLASATGEPTSVAWYAASLWFHALCVLIFIPGGIGAAVGCFMLGWRDAWRPAAIGIGLVAAALVALFAIGRATAVNG